MFGAKTRLPNSLRCMSTFIDLQGSVLIEHVALPSSFDSCWPVDCQYNLQQDIKRHLITELCQVTSYFWSPHYVDSIVVQPVVDPIIKSSFETFRWKWATFSPVCSFSFYLFVIFTLQLLLLFLWYDSCSANDIERYSLASGKLSLSRGNTGWHYLKQRICASFCLVAVWCFSVSWLYLQMQGFCVFGYPSQ